MDDLSRIACLDLGLRSRDPSRIIPFRTWTWEHPQPVPRHCRCTSDNRNYVVHTRIVPPVPVVVPDTVPNSSQGTVPLTGQLNKVGDPSARLTGPRSCPGCRWHRSMTPITMLGVHALMGRQRRPAEPV